MPDIFHIARVLGVAAICFVFALALTPAITRLLKKYQVGKQIRTTNVPVFARLHKKKEGTPTMGGILIWITVLTVTLLFGFLLI